jgi:hypothetical protein
MQVLTVRIAQFRSNVVFVRATRMPDRLDLTVYSLPSIDVGKLFGEQCPYAGVNNTDGLVNPLSWLQFPGVPGRQRAAEGDLCANEHLAFVEYAHVS